MINMNTPIGATPLDRPGGLIGQPLDRIDGPLKVTGTRRYAYEYRPQSAPAYGYLALSTIARGRVTAIDTAAAERAPGVLLVLTSKNMPAQARRVSRHGAATGRRSDPVPRPADGAGRRRDASSRPAPPAVLVQPSYAADAGAHDSGRRAAIGR